MVLGVIGALESASLHEYGRNAIHGIYENSDWHEVIDALVQFKNQTINESSNTCLLLISCFEVTKHFKRTLVLAD